MQLAACSPASTVAVINLCCINWCSTDSNNGPDNPKNCPFPWGISTPSNTRFFRPTQIYNLQSAYQLVQPFLHGSWTWPTDRHTDHATPSVAIGSILCLTACDAVYQIHTRAHIQNKYQQCISYSIIFISISNNLLVNQDQMHICSQYI